MSPFGGALYQVWVMGSVGPLILSWYIWTVAHPHIKEIGWGKGTKELLAWRPLVHKVSEILPICFSNDLFVFHPQTYEYFGCSCMQWTPAWLIVQIVPLHPLVQGNYFLEAQRDKRQAHHAFFWKEPLLHSWLVADYKDHCSCHSFMLCTIMALNVQLYISCRFNYFVHFLCTILHDYVYLAILHWCSADALHSAGLQWCSQEFFLHQFMCILFTHSFAFIIAGMWTRIQD